MLEVQDVHYSYTSNVEALKGVSITIKNGEFVAIMGQNGAGKTTLIKHFNGLLKPLLARYLSMELKPLRPALPPYLGMLVLFFKTPTINCSVKLLMTK
jgi:ABC-type multidrug transport system ATPase subunit